MNITFKRLLSTSNDFTPLLIRIFLGLVLLPHGLQKTVGMFGGYGFSGTIGFFTGTMGLPWILALLVILGESLGSISILLGFMTRFTALSFILIMLGAIFTVHLDNGFFMNWYGSQKGEGFEYHLLVIGMSLALLLSGGGKASVDGRLSNS